MLRVLHTIASTREDHGGTSRSIPRLCDVLSDHDLEVGLVTGSAGTVPLILPGERVRTNLASGRSWFGDYFDVVSGEAERWRPSIVHDHGMWLASNIASGRAAQRHGVPFVVSPRGMLSPWSLSRHRFRKRLAWWVFQQRLLESACVLHATSHAEVEDLRSLGLALPIAMIPNGIDVPGESPLRKPKRRHRALFLSRLHPKKGLPILIEAWSRVRPDDWELVIAGPDETGEQAGVRDAVRKAGLDGVVEFRGSVSDTDKWALYASSDLFLLPTHSENFGSVIAEALASGVPVITTRGAPWRELLTRQCGWWVDVDADAVAKALEDAVSLSAGERTAMGVRGRRLIEERYSWSQSADQMVQLYRWIMGMGSRPASVVWN